MANSQRGKPSSLPLASIAERVKAGESTADLADEYGVTERTLHERLRDAGFRTQAAEPERAARTSHRGPDLTWMEDAACRTDEGQRIHDAAIQFQSMQATATARTFCRSRCQVREQCLAWAVSTDEPGGVWGGYDRDERAAIARGVNPGSFEPPTEGPCRDCDRPMLAANVWQRAAAETRKAWRSHGLVTRMGSKPYCNACEWAARRERRQCRAWARNLGIAIPPRGIPAHVWEQFRAEQQRERAVADRVAEQLGSAS